MSKSYNSTAFVPGLGLETEISPRFAFRTEYRMALHRTKSAQEVASATRATIIKTSPTIHYFNVGLIFKI